MYTFGLTDYDNIYTVRYKRPSYCRQVLNKLVVDPANKQRHALNDTERLVEYLLSELAIEYVNKIPWDVDFLEQRLRCKSPINWQALYDAEIIHFYEGVPVDLTPKVSQNGVDPQTKRRMTEIVNNFNKMAARCQVPGVKKIARSSERFKHLKARAQDGEFYKEYRKCFPYIENSAFCNGEKGWLFTFDFFVKASSLDKILSGTYGSPDGDTKTLTISVIRDGAAAKLYAPSQVKPTDTIVGRYKLKGE